MYLNLCKNSNLTAAISFSYMLLRQKSQKRSLYKTIVKNAVVTRETGEMGGGCRFVVDRFVSLAPRYGFKNIRKIIYGVGVASITALYKSRMLYFDISLLILCR